jgi:hypothetical protein
MPTRSKRSVGSDVKSFDGAPMALPQATDKSSVPFEQMIAEAAYYRAEKRGFEAGHEVDDWLTAEREIAALAEAAV